MTFCSLASSSAGNAYLVSDGETSLLLECGISFQKLRRATGFTLSKIAACFVTHEHGDHAQAAARLLREGIPVYMSYGTARALGLQDAEIVERGKPIQIGALRVLPFRVWHDAAEPVGYLIEDGRTGERLLFAADTRNLDWIVPRLTYIAVECNYDDRALGLSERINPKVRERIRHTHMEVESCIKYLHKLDLSGVLCIWLLHLSDSHSREIEWRDRFNREFSGIEIRFCEK